MVAPPAQGVEPTPPPLDSHLVTRLGADDVSNAQLIKQVEQIHVGEPAVSRQDEAAALDAPEQVVEEGAQELPLVATHPLSQLRVVVSAPVNGDGSPTDPQGGDEQVPGVFRRPVERETDGSCRGQLSGDGARLRERQLFRRESRVVEQARGGA